MVDVSDIERNIDNARDFAAEDPNAMGMRMFDGIAYLLIEIIRELREIKQELHNQGVRMPDGSART